MADAVERLDVESYKTIASTERFDSVQLRFLICGKTFGWPISALLQISNGQGLQKKSPHHRVSPIKTFWTFNLKQQVCINTTLILLQIIKMSFGKLYTHLVCQM